MEPPPLDPASQRLARIRQRAAELLARRLRDGLCSQPGRIAGQVETAAEPSAGRGYEAPQAAQEAGPQEAAPADTVAPQLSHPPPEVASAPEEPLLAAEAAAAASELARPEAEASASARPGPAVPPPAIRITRQMAAHMVPRAAWILARQAEIHIAAEVAARAQEQQPHPPSDPVASAAAAEAADTAAAAVMVQAADVLTAAPQLPHPPSGAAWPPEDPLPAAEAAAAASELTGAASSAAEAAAGASELAGAVSSAAEAAAGAAELTGAASSAAEAATASAARLLVAAEPAEVTVLAVVAESLPKDSGAASYTATRAAALRDLTQQLRALVAAAFPAAGADASPLARLSRSIAGYLAGSPHPKMGPHTARVSHIGSHLRMAKGCGLGRDVEVPTPLGPFLQSLRFVRLVPADASSSSGDEAVRLLPAELRRMAAAAAGAAAAAAAMAAVGPEDVAVGLAARAHCPGAPPPGLEVLGVGSLPRDPPPHLLSSTGLGAAATAQATGREADGATGPAAGSPDVLIRSSPAAEAEPAPAVASEALPAELPAAAAAFDPVAMAGPAMPVAAPPAATCLPSTSSEAQAAAAVTFASAPAAASWGALPEPAKVVPSAVLNAAPKPWPTAAAAAAGSTGFAKYTGPTGPTKHKPTDPTQTLPALIAAAFPGHNSNPLTSLSRSIARYLAISPRPELGRLTASVSHIGSHLRMAKGRLGPGVEVPQRLKNFLQALHFVQVMPRPGSSGDDLVRLLPDELRSMAAAPGACSICGGGGRGNGQVACLEAACGTAAATALLDSRAVVAGMCAMLGIAPPPVSGPAGSDAAPEAALPKLAAHVAEVRSALAKTGLWSDRPGLLAALAGAHYATLKVEAETESGAWTGRSGPLAPERLQAATRAARHLPELWGALCEGLAWVAAGAGADRMAAGALGGPGQPGAGAGHPGGLAYCNRRGGG
ncbi:hypothetical protein HYH03_011399 [Edaphochlamys debaryana]|uniref:Uncharacterized protein n=1 Tax=Edaphochlamys debaryana TaxID=47281 RepID=A0A836BWF4_9CHLO|nr:hypothetical protein HYH03_011399 [Edaphochlamys debaryana]|eukprot:KAG2490093.1 hypothetical protein HYH03_011399 [Edaphochlamys debaryana]